MVTGRSGGFTLLEISIVLVIIGLLAGATLVGRDLLKAAEIRGTVSQIEKFNVAVHTFQTKYGCLPGDCSIEQDRAFGLYAPACVGPTDQYGDGNGLIEASLAYDMFPHGEQLTFWRHLSDAGLIAGQFGRGACNLVGCGETATIQGNDKIAQCLPTAKLGRNAHFIVYADDATNYYRLVSVKTIVAAFGGYTAGPAVSPTEAYSLDTKMDDGLPNKGSVVARNAGGLLLFDTYSTWASTSTSAKCMMGGATDDDPADTYNLLPQSGGDDTSCSLRFKMH